MSYQVDKTEQQWREELSADEYRVLRQAGTERAWSHPDASPSSDDSEYVYACRACGTELFRSQAKFDSHCGWPSFYEPLAKDRVEYLEDTTLGMTRTEVRCATCGSHLGHRFSGEGYPTPTDQRYCINGIALRKQATTGS